MTKATVQTLASTTPGPPNGSTIVTKKEPICVSCNTRVWLTTYLIAMTIGLIWLVYYSWQKIGTASTLDTPSIVVIIMTSGGLGGLIHSCRSYYFHAIKEDVTEGRAHKYILRPFTGAVLALIFFYAVQAGMSDQGNIDIGSASLMGYAAVAALVGMFSDQASAKLKCIAESIFTKPDKVEAEASK